MTAIDLEYSAIVTKRFGIANVPVLSVSKERSVRIAVCELNDSRPVPDPVRVVSPQDAYLVSLHLSDETAHRYWERGRELGTFQIQKGQAVLEDLRRLPQSLFLRPFHVVQFYVPRAALDAVAAEVNSPPVGDLQFEPGAGSFDAKVMNLGMSLLAELREPALSHGLFVDHVGIAMASHVAQRYGLLSPLSQRLRGRLAPWQERRAKDFFDAHLDGRVSVEDIARECSLSVSHFSRAFRKSTGKTPYGWLTKRRIELAKEKLHDRGRTIAQIALECGFADQSHFTRTFSREIGSSPGLWRRCLAA